jgi:hypothetical protein
MYCHSISAMHYIPGSPQPARLITFPPSLLPPPLLLLLLLLLSVCQAVEDLCMHQMQSRLYGRLQAECDAHIGQQLAALQAQAQLAPTAFLEQVRTSTYVCVAAAAAAAEAAAVTAGNMQRWFV